MMARQILNPDKLAEAQEAADAGGRGLGRPGGGGAPSWRPRRWRRSSQR